MSATALPTPVTLPGNLPLELQHLTFKSAHFGAVMQAEHSSLNITVR